MSISKIKIDGVVHEIKTTIPNIEGLQDKLDKKADVDHIHSWNGLTDKPFGETKEVVEILPECQPIGGGEPFTFVVSENVPTLIVGETYTVNWNGVDYNCVIQDLSAMMPGAVGFGDLTQMGASGNGEPFGAVVAENPSGVLLVFQPIDGTTELTVSIRQEQTTVTPLPVKYLPDGVPYISDQEDPNAMALELLVECGIVKPVCQNHIIYISPNNEIYAL